MRVLVVLIGFAIYMASLFAFDKIAKEKGRQEMWPLGAALGPFGVILIALMPSKRLDRA